MIDGVTTSSPSGEVLPLSHDVYQRLLDSLTSSEIGPGERITVDDLARRLDISQTPIREALARLEAEGLVEKLHLRGYRASPQLDTAALRQLFALRALVEPAAAWWAAERIETGQCEALRALLDRMEAQARHRQYGDFAVVDARFHALVAEASGNRILRDSLARLHVHLHLFRVRRDAGVADTAVEEHTLIVQAIERGDPLVAEAAMRSHIECSWSRLDPQQDADAAEDMLRPSLRYSPMFPSNTHSAHSSNPRG